MPFAEPPKIKIEPLVNDVRRAFIRQRCILGNVDHGSQRMAEQRRLVERIHGDINEGNGDELADRVGAGHDPVAQGDTLVLESLGLGPRVLGTGSLRYTHATGHTDRWSGSAGHTHGALLNDVVVVLSGDTVHLECIGFVDQIK